MTKTKVGSSSNNGKDKQVQESQNMEQGQEVPSNTNEDASAKVDVEGGNGGLQDIPLNYGFKDRVSKDLVDSGYTSEEIYSAMDQPIEIEVVQVEVPINETQVEVVFETQDEDGIDDTQPVTFTSPKVEKKIRKRSERVVKAKLGRRIDGPGASSDNPVTLN